MENKHNERNALILSIVGALIMAALGIGFSFLTGSNAILLDGLFSLAGAGGGFVALKIADLVQQPDDEHFQFGYASFEPMFNLFKGLIIAFVGIYAALAAIDSLMQGGRPINTGYALIYGVLVSTACFIVAVYQRRVAKKANSPLVEVDAANWFIDGALTLAVLAAFLIAYLMRGTSYEWMIDYVDPAIVVSLVALTAPVPFLIIRDNLRELLLGAPDSTLQQKVTAAIAAELSEFPDADYHVRMVKLGRRFFLSIYLILPASGHPADEISVQDSIRERIVTAIKPHFPASTAEVLFTRDRKWVGIVPESTARF